MRYRDLTLIEHEGIKLLFATDSIGGIGEKENDFLAIDNVSLGRFLAQVPFFEILAVGAKPSYVFLPVSNEMDSTARGIIRGVRELMIELGLSPEAINGSTEENMPTSETGVGITVMAICDRNFNFPIAKKGEYIFSLGLPKVGAEVVEDRGEIMNLALLKRLREFEFVGDILPVGSKGIAYEAGEMARSHNLDLEFILEGDILTKSAGPTTVVLCSSKIDYKKELEKLGLAVNIVARLT